MSKRRRVEQMVAGFMLGALSAASTGCASPSAPPAPAHPAKPTLLSDVRPANVDLRRIRDRLLFTPAMVAIYAKDGTGDVTFDSERSAQGRGSLDTLLRYAAGLANVRMIEFQKVASTPLSGDEFYTRMDRATTEATVYCVRNRICSRGPLWFGTPVTAKFSSWPAPLAADYAMFFKVVGAYSTADARSHFVVAGSVAGASGGLIGAMIGVLIAESLSTERSIASASVVDLRDGRIVWFKATPVADIQNIAEMRQAMGELVSGLY